MSEHVNEANRMLEESSLIAEWSEQERLVLVTRAQAEATLALVEQQRIANMVALYSQEDLSDVPYGYLLKQIKLGLRLP